MKEKYGALDVSPAVTGRKWLPLGRYIAGIQLSSWQQRYSKTMRMTGTVANTAAGTEQGKNKIKQNKTKPT